ncbi:MAG: transketolase C-terminal domain-containing protein, partial [Bacillota bacterium]|nr:transketolase C-terminal domain-containing protein [Bacillota bacterium]
CATHACLAVGEDGASHQAIEDVAIMRALPNMKVFVPCDQYETKAVIEYVSKINGPCYVRLGRGKVEDVFNENTKFDFTKANVIRKGNGDVVLFALKATEEIDATVVNICSIKPLDKDTIIELLKSHKRAYVCEEHSIIGGLYSTIAEVKAATDIQTPIIPIGVNDTFGESGKAKDVLEKYGLTAKHILEVVNE